MTIYELPLIIIITLFGACLASFSNNAALRTSAGKSFVGSRSRCPKCGEVLRWYELIPIISYFIQLGKCRKCKQDISIRYFLVELVGAALAALCYIRFGLSLVMPAAFIITAMLLAVSLFDISMMEIPNGLILALIPFAIVMIWLQPEVTIVSRAIGFACISLPMLLIALIVNGAFGGGDIKLMAICGFMLGWQNVVVAFFIAVFISGIYALTLIIRKKAKKRAHIAFSPYLCLGTSTALLYGRQILAWYLGLYGL